MRRIDKSFDGSIECSNCAVETHSIMPFVVSDDPIQFVVIFKFVKIAMVIGYSGDLNFQEVAAAIEKIAMGHMYALPGATARCFHFILPVTRLATVVFQCCLAINVVCGSFAVVFQKVTIHLPMLFIFV